MCFNFHDSPYMHQNHTMLQVPKISNQIKLGCGYLRTGSFIIFRCYKKGSAHLIGLVQHLELPLMQNSTSWDNF